MRPSRIIIALVFALFIGASASAQEYKQVGDSLVLVEQPKAKAQPIDTGLTVKIKDVTYPVYQGSKGGYFIIRISGKTGRKYTQYLKIKQ